MRYVPGTNKKQDSPTLTELAAEGLEANSQTHLARKNKRTYSLILLDITTSRNLRLEASRSHRLRFEKTASNLFSDRKSRLASVNSILVSIHVTLFVVCFSFVSKRLLSRRLQYHHDDVAAFYATFLISFDF